MYRTRESPELRALNKLVDVLRKASFLFLFLLIPRIALAQEVREPPAEAVQLFDEALAHYEAGQYPDAAEDLELALTLDPGSPTLLYNLARVYELMGELDKAVDYGTQYLQLIPEAASDERADGEAMLRRLEGARDWLRLREQAQQPDAPPVLRQLAPRVIVRDRGVADLPFWVTLGSGAALVVAGAILGGVTLSLESDVNGRRIQAGDSIEDYEQCLRSDGDRADRFALTTDILLGLGGAAVVSAFLMYVLRVRTYERDADVSVDAEASAQGGQLLLRGTF
ncbi:MAG: tetratricopeptide repeat protein [Myxococcota bacterium]